MKHFVDLPACQIVDIVKEAYSLGEIFAGEKLDGSFIKVVKDDNSKVYIQRKSDVKYYSVSDWPEMAWSNDFRAAHIVLEELAEKMNPGEFIDFELISGPLANSIEYDIPHDANFLIIIDTNIYGPIDRALSVDISTLPNWLATYNQQVSKPKISSVTSTPWICSNDGTSLEVKPETKTWMIFLYQVRRWYIHSLIPQNVISFLNTKIGVRDSLVEIKHVIDCKLNKKPDFISAEDWKNDRKQIIAILEEKRILLRKQMETIIFNHLRASHILESRTEGIVLQTQKGLFKLVDRQYFSKVNNFTHIVKYWLMGGRRPNRPSFLSRTADWPLEKRLARLEVLRERFVRHHSRLQFARPGDQILSYSHPQLYKRTIVLFAEIREGLINGRFGVQR